VARKTDKLGGHFMQKAVDNPSKRDGAITQTVDFNFNKPVAALCITASAATSVVVIVWIVQSFF
jgi:hypothetical protein